MDDCSTPAKIESTDVGCNKSANVYNFKSSGAQQTEWVAEQRRDEIILAPIGIKTPMELGNSYDGIFKMHTDIEDQVQDNFRNLVLTNHGERLGRTDFGANLSELAHELGSEKQDQEAIERIKKAVSKYMPFLSLETFTAKVDHHSNMHTAKTVIQITYKVSALSNKKKMLEAVIYTTG